MVGNLKSPMEGHKIMYSINTRLDGVSVFITEDRRKREEILFSELLIQEDCLGTIKRLRETYGVSSSAIQECFTEGISYYKDKDPEIIKRFQGNANAFCKAYHYIDNITYQNMKTRLRGLLRRLTEKTRNRSEASFTLVLQSR